MIFSNKYNIKYLGKENNVNICFVWYFWRPSSV